MSDSKKNIVPISAIAVVAVLFALSAIGSFRAFAEGEKVEIRAEFLKGDDSANYFYIDEPYSISASEINIFVTSRNRSVYRFSPDGVFIETLSYSDNIDDTVSLKGKRFMLKNGELESEDGNAIASGVSDICSDGEKLYALTDSSLLVFDVPSDNAEIAAPKEIAHGIARARLIASNGGETYVIADSGLNAYQSDVYLLDAESGTSSKALAKTPHATDAAAVSGSLILAQNGRINGYFLGGGSLEHTATAGTDNIVSVCAFGENVSALSGDGAVLSLSPDLKEVRTLLACTSDADWFYNSLSSVSTRRDYILIADSGNNRVVKIGPDKFNVVEGEFSYPQAAVADHLGNIYVAHGGTKVDVLNRHEQFEYSVAIENERITDLKLNSSTDTLYALTASGKVYRASRGEEKFAAMNGIDGMNAVAVSPDKSNVYGMSKASGKIFDLTSREPVVEFTCDAADFALDIEDGFYILTADGKIEKHASGGDIFIAEFENGHGIVDGADGICISSVKNDHVGYGDILISNSERHCLQKISASDYGVKVGDDSFTPPSYLTDSSPRESGEIGIIRTALSDLDVYEKPIDMSPHAVISSGRKVIAAEFDAEAGFAYILCDDTENNVLIRGYVLKNQLSDPLEYKKPTSKTATVSGNNTPVYKWPSRLSEKIDGYASVDKDASFALLDFVYDGKDSSGKTYYGMADEFSDSRLWYRISLDGGYEGYIPASAVHIGSYIDLNRDLQLNAKIISKTGAPMYEKDSSGKFVMIESEQPLKFDTKVEVVGTFDQSKEYTQIMYYNEVYKQVLPGWVRTEHLKYTGFDRLTLIIVILIILSVVGMIAVIIWHQAAKKKRMTRA